jgi:hypothetical protein
MWQRLRYAAIAAMLAGGVASSGCAKTGLGWVKRPEPGAISPRDHRVEPPEPTETVARPRPPSERPGEPVPPQRLSRTLSLGESVTVSDRAPPEAASGQPLVVQIVPPRSYSYGYFLTPEPILPVEPIEVNPEPIVVPPPPPPGAQPGRDWPAPPSFGPPFPFRSEPANPFEPAE